MLSKDFILAGRAVFTLEVSKDFQSKYNTKPHYTYLVDFVEGKGKWSDSYFVKLLTGPDNTRSYSYIGKIRQEDGFIILTKKSNFTQESIPVKLLSRILKRIWSDECDKISEAGFNLHHEGRCGRCGRVLTTPESIETGLGPICINKN